MNLSVNRCDDGRAQWLDAGSVHALTDIASRLSPQSRLLGLVVVDDRRIHEINREFRGKDRPTDVISFSYLDDTWGGDEDEPVGEIYVSYETLERDAEENGVDPRHLFLRMGVHGMLHVIGHDHETDAEAEQMEERERSLLAQCLPVDQIDRLF